MKRPWLISPFWTSMTDLTFHKKESTEKMFSSHIWRLYVTVLNSEAAAMSTLTISGVQVNAYQLMTVKERNGAILSASALVRHFVQLQTVSTMNGWTQKEKESALQTRRKKCVEDKDIATGKADALVTVTAHSILIFRLHQIRLSNQFAIRFLQNIQITSKELCVKLAQKLDCTQRKETCVKTNAHMVNALSNSKQRTKSPLVLTKPCRRSETTSKRFSTI